MDIQKVTQYLYRTIKDAFTICRYILSLAYRQYLQGRFLGGKTDPVAATSLAYHYCHHHILLCKIQAMQGSPDRKGLENILDIGTLLAGTYLADSSANASS